MGIGVPKTSGTLSHRPLKWGVADPIKICPSHTCYDRPDFSRSRSNWWA